MILLFISVSVPLFYLSLVEKPFRDSSGMSSAFFHTNHSSCSFSAYSRAFIEFYAKKANLMSI